MESQSPTDAKCIVRDSVGEASEDHQQKSVPVVPAETRLLDFARPWDMQHPAQLSSWLGPEEQEQRDPDQEELACYDQVEYRSEGLLSGFVTEPALRHFRAERSANESHGKQSAFLDPPASGLGASFIKTKCEDRDQIDQ